MRSGDLVKVTLLGGDKVERRIWRMMEDGSALVCTAEAYEAAKNEGMEPPTIGFRRQFIEEARGV